MTLVHAIYVGGMRTMTKKYTYTQIVKIAQYINDLLADRERLMEERKDDHKQWQGIPELYSDLKKDTEWELSMIYKAQKSMDYIIEEAN